MRYLSEHMRRVTAATNIMAGVSFELGVLLLWLAGLGDWNREGTSLHMALGATLFYLLPGTLLLIFGWRMGKADLWAYVGTTVLSFLLLAKFVMAYVAFKASQVQFTDDPIFCETIGRLPCLYLIVGCLNVMPDVRDAYRGRWRERQLARRGFEPLMSTAPAVRPPPPPVTSIPRPGRSANRPSNL